MSLFNLVMGNSGYPPALLDLMFDVTPEICPRYRDHWLERDGDDAIVLAVYTRTGGGNREEYAQQNAQMQALPTYVSDADDTYDSTYATFRFRMDKSQWYARMDERDALVEGVTKDTVWEELWRTAEPIPRDMAVIWEAMISSLPGNFDEKV